MKLKKLLHLAVYFIGIGITVLPAYAIEKHALIIANQDYKHGASLANPINDSKVLSKTLEDAGFKVTIEENLGYLEMRKTISHFGLEQSETDNVALVYYAGHGAEFNGNNYLIPVDAKLEDARKARQEALTLDDVQNFMYREVSEQDRSSGRNAKGLNIIVLDACRNNPYPARERSASRGLGKVDGASGTLIWYAAQPGARAADGTGDGLSPFAASFVEALDKSNGETVEETFKQVASLTLKATEGAQNPWTAGNILGRFSFKPGTIRNTGKRYLDEFDPAQQIKPSASSGISKPKEWTTVRETFGDWKYGSMGKFHGEAFVSLSGIWQETGSDIMPYVMIEPFDSDDKYDNNLYNYNNLFNVNVDIFNMTPTELDKYYRDTTENLEESHIVAFLTYVFLKQLPSNQVTEKFDNHRIPHNNSEKTTFGMCQSTLHNNEQVCYYTKPIYKPQLRTFINEKKYQLMPLDGDDNYSGEFKPISISLNGSSKAFEFLEKKLLPVWQHLKISESEIGGISDDGTFKVDYIPWSKKALQSENLWQCKLIEELEMMITAYDDNTRFSVKDIYDFAKKRYDNGEYECGYLLGYTLLHADSTVVNMSIDERVSEAVRLMLDGLQQRYSAKRLHLFADYWKIFPRYTDIYSLRDWSLILDQVKEMENDMSKSYSDVFYTHPEFNDYFIDQISSDIFDRLRKNAWKKCRQIEKESILDSEKIPCYEEFANLFPNSWGQVVKNRINLIQRQMACGSVEKIWSFIKNSSNIEMLNTFINENQKCSQADLARARIQELQ